MALVGRTKQGSADTLTAVILANRLGMTRRCAQNERVVFTNKLSITSAGLKIAVNINDAKFGSQLSASFLEQCERT